MQKNKTLKELLMNKCFKDKRCPKIYMVWDNLTEIYDP